MRGYGELCNQSSARDQRAGLNKLSTPSTKSRWPAVAGRFGEKRKSLCVRRYGRAGEKQMLTLLPEAGPWFCDRYAPFLSFPHKQPPRARNPASSLFSPGSPVLSGVYDTSEQLARAVPGFFARQTPSARAGSARMTNTRPRSQMTREIVFFNSILGTKHEFH